MKILLKPNSIYGAVAIILFAMFGASSCRRDTQSARSRVMDAGAGEPVDMLLEVVTTATDKPSLGFTYTFAPEASGISAQGLSLQWTDVPSTAVVMPETGKKQVPLKAIGVVAKLNVQSGAASGTNSLVCLSKDLIVGEVAKVYCTNSATENPDPSVKVFKNPESLNDSEAKAWLKYIEVCNTNGLPYGTTEGELTGCYCTRPDVQIKYPRVSDMNTADFAAYFDKFKAQCSAELNSQKSLDSEFATACIAPHKTDSKNSMCNCGNGPIGSLKFSTFKQSSTAVVDFKTALGKLCTPGSSSVATKEALIKSCGNMKQVNDEFSEGCYCTLPDKKPAVDVKYSDFAGKSNGVALFESACTGKTPYIPPTAGK